MFLQYVDITEHKIHRMLIKLSFYNVASHFYSRIATSVKPQGKGVTFIRRRFATWFPFLALTQSESNLWVTYSTQYGSLYRLSAVITSGQNKQISSI